MKTTRKTLAMLIVLCMMVCFAPLRAQAAIPNDFDGTFGSGNTYLVDKASHSILLSGAGKMPDFKDADSVPWQAGKDKLQTVIINDGLTSVSDHAFENCVSLRRLVLAESVKEIAPTAFAGCTSLRAVQTTGSVGDLRTMLEKAGMDASRLSITQISKAQFGLLVSNVKRSDEVNLRAADQEDADDGSQVIIRYDFAKRPISIEERDNSGNVTTTYINYKADPAEGKNETVETRYVIEFPAEGSDSFTYTTFNDVGVAQYYTQGELDENSWSASQTEFFYGQYGATGVSTLDSVTVEEDGTYTLVWTIRGHDLNDYNAFNEYREGKLSDGDAVNGVRESFGISAHITKEIQTYTPDQQITSIQSTTTEYGMVKKVYSAEYSYDEEGRKTTEEVRTKFFNEEKDEDKLAQEGEIIQRAWTTTYEYDDQTGNLATATSAINDNGEQYNRVTEYSYYEASQLLRSAVATRDDDPDWTASEQFEYNENGSVTKYSYDHPEMTQTVEYSYDAQGLKTGKTDTVVTMEADETVVTTVTETSYNGDERAESRKETQTKSNELWDEDQVSTVETSYRYGDGTVVQSSVSTYTDGETGDITVTTTGFNEMGFIESQEFVTTKGDAQETRTESYTYDENGILLASSSENVRGQASVSNTCVYRDDGQLEGSEYTLSHGEMEILSMSETYEYNADGLTEKMEVSVDMGARSFTESVTMSYNEDGRILSSTNTDINGEDVEGTITAVFVYADDGSCTETVTVTDENGQHDPFERYFDAEGFPAEELD